jgi:hypothetical protein
MEGYPRILAFFFIYIARLLLNRGKGFIALRITIHFSPPGDSRTALSVLLLICYIEICGPV